MTNSLEPSGQLTSPSTSGPSWHWRFEDSSGGEVTAESIGTPSFPSQGDAESWVGESWRELLDAGVDAVTLFEGDREVYGPMSLHPAT